MQLMSPDGEAIDILVEVVNTPQAMQQGLMFREFLDENHGMFFDFGSEHKLSMWMKNTLIPLDMLFLNEGARVVHIVENTEPKTLTPHSTPVPARYVLELNAGFAAKHRITLDSEVRSAIFE